MPYFRLTMFGILDMTCPAALPLVYLSYTDCDLTMTSMSCALATVFTQNDSFTLSFSSVTVLPYFRLTMLGIIDMTCPAVTPSKQAAAPKDPVLAMFDKYREQDEDKIGPDGIIALCQDMQIDPTDVRTRQ